MPFLSLALQTKTVVLRFQGKRLEGSANAEVS